MNVERIDERALGEQGYGSNFVVFIYEGGDSVFDGAWSVDSLLLTDADLPQALAWLRDNLPEGCCWSSAAVKAPAQPSQQSELDVAWIIGDDVLNTPHANRSPEEHRVAAEMLARRHRVALI